MNLVATQLHWVLNKRIITIVVSFFSTRLTRSPDAIIIDGCALLWSLPGNQLYGYPTRADDVVILNVSYNKAWLVKLICHYLMDHVVSDTNRLVVTSENPVPNDICNGRNFVSDDLHTTHKEADIIIVQQMVNLSEHGCISIKVICDDTDVFVLLMYFYNEKRLSCIVAMESPIAGRSVIDIGASAA